MCTLLAELSTGFCPQMRPLKRGLEKDLRMLTGTKASVVDHFNPRAVGKTVESIAREINQTQIDIIGIVEDECRRTLRIDD